MIKKIASGVVLLLLLLLVWNYELVGYGLGQAQGQLKVIRNARPIEDYLQDNTFPEPLKEKIRLVQEIRQYAFDSLGLNESDNYTTLYNQHDKPILWNVTASPPFEMKAYEWKFPFLGSVSYKGFFDYQKAQTEATRLEKEGYETQIDEVGGWSTLGWFKDPILSNMLKRTEGSLANVIIHELTHGTLYVKNNVTYNENLASFVGDHGAARFLEQKYGKDSEEYRRYVLSKEDYRKYSQHVLNGASKLDSLYNTFSDKQSVQAKQQLKEKYIRQFAADIDTISFTYPERYRNYFSPDSLPNNNYFLSYKRYREEQNVFEDEFNQKFNGDFKKYMAYLKETYPSL
jgi:predicted aminopeptidase